MSDNLPVPKSYVPDSPQDIEEDALVERSAYVDVLIEQRKDHPLYDKALRWLQTIDIDDPKAEFEGQLAALKVWGPLDKGFREMITAAKGVNKDRATSLQLEKERAQKAVSILRKISDKLKHPEKFTDEERAKEIAKVDKLIDGLGRIK